MFKRNYESRFTYMNGGTAFSFKPGRFTKQAFRKGGSTMLRMHAELTLDAIKDGRKDVFILGSDGQPLTKEVLEAAAAGKWKV